MKRPRRFYNSISLFRIKLATRFGFINKFINIDKVGAITSGGLILNLFNI